MRSPLLLVVLLLALSDLPLGAQTKGEITGTVTNIDPALGLTVVPGAQVTLAAAVKPNMSLASATSGADGRFTFKNLEPGEYVLSATLAGFERARKPVTVRAGGLSEVALELKVAPVQQKVTVESEAEGIQIQQTSSEGEVKAQTLQSAPLINERFLDAIPLLPGVVRGPDGSINIKGARSYQSGLLVNSANATDPVTGEYAISLPIDVIQNLEVLNNPYSAEYGKFSSAVTHIETKPASDRFRFQLQNFVPRLRKRGGVFRGLESFTPRVTFSAPLIRDKLSFVQSWEYRIVRTPVTSLPPLERDQQIETFDSFTQVDWTINSSHRFGAVVSVFPQNLRYPNLNTFNPQATTADFRQRGFLFLFQDRLLHGPSLLESMFSVMQFDASAFPARSGPTFILTPDLNRGSFFNTQDRDSMRYEWQEIYHFRPLQWRGMHQLKAGIDYSWLVFDGSHESRPVLIERQNGTLAQRIDFVGTTRFSHNKQEYATFLQDRWNPRRRLTFDLGLRFDPDSLADENNLAPRLGFAYVLTADMKTVLRGGVGLFYDKVPLNVAIFPILQERVVTTYGADGITLVDGPRRFLNVVEGNRLRTPRSVAINLEIDRELRRGLMLRIGYAQREGRREYVIEPLENLDGSGTLRLAAAGHSRYREFQVTTVWRINEASLVNVSYVRSRAQGNLNDYNQFFGNFENPIIRPDEFSLLNFDAANRFLFWGELRLPRLVMFAPVLEVRDGFPFSLIDANRNFIGTRNRAGRFPVFSSFDIQVFRDFPIPFKGKKRPVRVGIKFFNLFNHFNPRDVQNNVDASLFGDFFNDRGRLIRAKFSVEFLP